MKIKPLKVSELNSYIRKIIYSNPILNNISVTGEVRDHRTSKSGYQYFNLCDEGSIISCIVFHPDIEIIPDQMMIITGKVEIYDKRSTYQIVVDSAEGLTEGLEGKYLKELKEKLAKKGYFDKSRKKALPEFPRKIGIITSLDGAVIEDMKRVINEYPVGIHIFMYNSFVQGRSAVYNIVSGLKYFNEIERCDVIILARGGGSKLDLDIFNDEILVDTIYQSKVPIITGIGHGTDLSVADMTSDKEVQTPTAAAELALKHYRTSMDALPEMKNQLRLQYTNYMLRNKHYVNMVKERLNVIDGTTLLSRKYEYLEKNRLALSIAFNDFIRSKQDQLVHYHLELNKNDLVSILDRGFLYASDINGLMITDLKSLKVNQHIRIENLKTYINTTIDEIGEK
jgi:exodeoxyribonuclease VII large subunit